MATLALRSVDIPRITGGPTTRFPELAAHRARRRALDILRAFEAIGEPCTYRIVMPDGTLVPSEELTDQDSAEVRGDLEHLATIVSTSLDALLGMLYAASSHGDRSRIAPALDRMLAYLDHWRSSSPERVTALFERLEPSRLVRAVGQTLLASTRLAGDRSAARQEFLSRFLEDLRIRGTHEASIARLRKGLET